MLEVFSASGRTCPAMLEAFSVSSRGRPVKLDVFLVSSRARLVNLKVLSASSRGRAVKLDVFLVLSRTRLFDLDVFSVSSRRRPVDLDVFSGSGRGRPAILKVFSTSSRRRLVDLKVFSASRGSAPRPWDNLRVHEVGFASGNLLRVRGVCSTSGGSAPRQAGDAAHQPPSLRDRIWRGGGSQNAQDNFPFQRVEHLYSLTTSRVHFTPITHQHPRCHGRVWESASPGTQDLPLSPAISPADHVRVTCQPNASHMPTSRPPLAQQSRGSRRATMSAFCRTVSPMRPTLLKRGACLPGLGRCRPQAHKETFTKKMYRSWGSLLQNRAFVRLLCGTGPTDAAGLASFGWDLSPPCQRR